MLLSGKEPRLVCSDQSIHCSSSLGLIFLQSNLVADGLRVPAAVGDFLILAAIRESHGTAVAVSDEEMLEASKIMGMMFRLISVSEVRTYSTLFW